jgi:hypothetical protein
MKSTKSVKDGQYDMTIDTTNYNTVKGVDLNVDDIEFDKELLMNNEEDANEKEQLWKALHSDYLKDEEDRAKKPK